MHEGFDVRLFGPLAIVRISGDLDLTTVDGPDRAVANIDLRPVSSLEVDLTAATFIDSSGLGWLARLHEGFDVRLFGPLAIVRISGDLDLTTVDGPDRAVANIDLRPVSSLEVDLTAATFIDSSGLGWLARLHDRCAHLGTALVVVAVEGSEPWLLIRRTGLDDRLRLVADRPLPAAGRDSARSIG